MKRIMLAGIILAFGVPVIAADSGTCEASGRTTMVRGACPIDWAGKVVRVEGNCDVTPGVFQNATGATIPASGKPCLRLRSPQAVTVPSCTIYTDPRSSDLLALVASDSFDNFIAIDGSIYGGNPGITCE